MCHKLMETQFASRGLYASARFGPWPRGTAAAENELETVTSDQIRELVERWRETIVPTIRESTAVYYNKTLDTHVLPYFAVREVAGIEKYDVQKFLAAKAGQGFCKNTLRGMRVSLGRVLGWAVENKWIPENVCKGVRLPESGTKVQRSILTPEQILAIVGELKEPYATFVLFLVITSLRVGEAIAIRWTDLKENELHVQRRIYEGKTGDVKTKNSRRILPLPQQRASTNSSMSTTTSAPTKLST
jgi:integrase